MKAFRRPSIAVLVLLNLWPTLAFGQATKAGVVSTLQGTVTASRTAVPQPIPLKFKDDVFLQDRIQTGDQSVARILLGGKALVTVRERSVLTITETPGRSTVNLEAGKIGLAVARERMSSGESVDIRTSNAVAAVRGTVVVAEVTRTTAQATPGPAQVVSNFYVLRDPTNRGIQITQLNTGATSNVLAGGGFSVLGGSAGRSVPIPANVNAGLQTSAGAQHSSGSAAATSSVASAQGQQAVVLANAVLGDPSISTPASEGSLMGTTQTGSGSDTSANQGNLICTTCTAVAEGAAAEQTPPPPPPPPPFIQPDITGAIDLSAQGGHVLVVNAGETVTIPGQLVVVHNANIINGGDLLVVNGTLTSEEPQDRAFIAVDPTFVNATGLLRVSSAPGFPAAAVNLKSPLVEATGTAAAPNHFIFSDDIVRITATGADAALTSTSGRALVILTQTNVDTNGHVGLLDGDSLNGIARLTLAGPLLLGTSANITLASANPLLPFLNEFLHLKEGAVVSGTGLGTFVQLNSSTVTIGSAATSNGNNEFLELGAQDSITIAGGLLGANASAISVHNSPVVRQTGGTFTAGGDIVALNNSTLTASQVLNLSGAGTLTTTGSVLSAAGGSTINLSDAFLVQSGGTLTSSGVLFVFDNSAGVSGGAEGILVSGGTLNAAGAYSVVNGGALTLSTPGAAAVVVDGATLNATSATTPLLGLTNGTLNIPGGVLGVINGGTVNLAAQALKATDSTLNFTDVTEVIGIHGSTVTGTGAVALIDLTRGTLHLDNEKLLLLDTGSTMTIAGPLFAADGTTITANVAVVSIQNATLNANGATLASVANVTSTNLPHLLDVEPGGILNSLGPLLSTTNSTLGFVSDPVAIVNGGTLNAGGLLTQTGGTITVGTLASPADLLGLFSGAVATVTGGHSAITVTNGTLTVTGALVFGDGTGNILTLTGPVLTATDSTVHIGTVAVTSGTDTVVASGTTPLLQLTRSTLTVDAGEVIQIIPGGAPPNFAGQAAVITGPGTVTVSDVFLDVANVSITNVNPLVQVLGGAVINSLNPSVPFILLGDGTTLAGPLLQVSNSTITGFSNLLDTTGLVTSNGTGSLITLDPSTTSTTSHHVLIEGTLDLHGPLLTSTNSTMTAAAGDFLRVARSAALVDQSAVVSTIPLLGFTGGTLTTSGSGGNIVQVTGNPVGGATLTLKRPLFSESGTTVSAFGNFLRIADGGLVSSTATTPFVQFSGGSYVGGTGGPGNGGAMLRMFSLAGENPASFTLQDGYLQATNGATFSAPNAVFADIRDSAQLTSNGTTPFLDFSGGSSASSGFNFIAIGPNSTANGNPGTDLPPTASFNGTLFRAADAGTPITFSNGGGNSFLSIFDGATVTKTGASPAIQLIGSVADGVVINSEGNILFLGTTGAVPPETPPTFTLAGSLIDATNARIISGSGTAVRSTVFIGDGATLTKTDSSAFINLATANLVAPGSVLAVRRSPSAGQRSTLNLATAPLFVATNSTANTISATGFNGAACCSSFFIGQGGRLLGTGAAPLIQLVNTPFNGGTSGVGGGNFFQVDDVCNNCGDTFNGTSIASIVNVAAPLLSASDSAITALRNLIFVRRSSLTSTSTSPLVDLVNTADRTYALGGIDPFPPNTELFGGFLDVTAAAGGSNSNASVQIQGPLLRTQNTGGRTTFNSTGDFFGIFSGASLSSSTTSPLIQSSDATYNVGNGTPFRHFFLVRDFGGVGGIVPASATVNGPLLTSTRDTFNATAAFLEVNGGGNPPVTFLHNNPADANPFMTFNRSVVTLGNATTPDVGNFFEVNSNTGIRYRGTGTLVQADTTGVAAWTGDRLLFSQTATPTVNQGFNSSSSNPLFSFSGAPIGTHTFANSLFDLKGFTTTIEGDPDASGLTVGTDQPLRHSGDLFRGSATPVAVGNTGGGNAIKLDTALFAATAPLMNLALGSAATTPSDFLKLVQNAKLTGNLLPADALVKLDASTLSILNGVLANVNGGSFMNLINTTLLSLTNSSTVNISANLNNFDAGALVRVAGGSVYKMTGGSLISFGSGTNTVTFTNPSNIVACGGTCSLQNVNFNGTLAPVLFKGGAGPGNLTVAPGFNAFPGIGGNNTINFTLGSSALFIVDGATSKVVLRP